MKDRIEKFEQYGIEVILGRDLSLKARLLRGFLRCLSVIYRQVVRLRLFLFRERVIRDHDLGCMVVSIGNLTVGGTGKTPVVELFARALFERGRRVAILSRGYKSRKTRRRRRGFWRRIGDELAGRSFPEAPPRVVSDGKTIRLDSHMAGDEPWMLARNLPGVPVLVDKDRVKSGRHALRRLAADTLLLDDGLQYLRLRHRVDVVLVDRTAPFGNEYMLPRGTLREPPRSLRRASYIFLTKSDGSPDPDLEARLRLYNKTAEIIECRHRPCYLEHVVTGARVPLEVLDGTYVGAISGIAVPESFENGLRALGAKVEVFVRYADHHRFHEEEVTRFLRRCLDRDLGMVVTTEKDAVRIPKLPRYDLPFYFLRIDIEILKGREHFDACIERICRPPRGVVRPAGMAVTSAAARAIPCRGRQ